MNIYYHFQCKKCFIISSYIGEKPEDAPICCGNKPMDAIPDTVHDHNEAAAIGKRLMIQEAAERHGMTLKEFARYRAELRWAWENGGGNEGAKERLKFAEDYLAKAKGEKGIALL